MGVLSISFRNLFTYCLQSEITVANLLANKHQPSVLFRTSIFSSSSTIQQLITLLQVLQNSPSQTPSNSVTTDSISWSLTKGTFTTASLYNFLNLLPKVPSDLRLIWKLKVPPRARTFTWLMLQDKLPTIDNLQKRGMILVNRCSLCRAACESSSHLFNTCIFFCETLSSVLAQSGTLLQDFQKSCHLH
ncbi:hypothetical protein LUZ63_010326 [Rhynchospora breviuscula]|uniref:Reverse transcriptase zinc-binding domain-containing protein n=1 Tax=Rhynchospora breviuscula TaxID=2022672 RepID=A0A9Q0HPV5_9POAL|nr:hypothetical protein LUZ63_010326 [Rhynchospora breviuscula]